MFPVHSGGGGGADSGVWIFVSFGFSSSAGGCSLVVSSAAVFSSKTKRNIQSSCRMHVVTCKVWQHQSCFSYLLLPLPLQRGEPEIDLWNRKLGQSWCGGPRHGALCKWSTGSCVWAGPAQQCNHSHMGWSPSWSHRRGAPARRGIDPHSPLQILMHPPMGPTGSGRSLHLLCAYEAFCSPLLKRNS